MERPELSDKPTSYQRYTNYGIVDYPERAPFLHMEMDTWYNLDEEAVGTLEVGHGPVAMETGAIDFVWEQLVTVRDAFTQFPFASQFARIGYHTFKPHRSGNLVDIRIDTQADFVADIRRVLHAPTDTIDQFFVWLDGIVAVRNEAGTLSEHRLPYVGRIWFRAHDAIRRFIDGGYGTHGQWQATFTMDFLSLFRRDNRELLRQVRARWQQLREQDPDVTRDKDEASPVAGIIALAALSPTVPPTNQELYDRNAPRLRQAIAAWEQAIHSTFRWQVSLDE